jgi:hypothetical protein
MAGEARIMTLEREPRFVYTILILAALTAYLPAIWWGAPHASATVGTQRYAWGTDDETPLVPLEELHNIIAPKPIRNLNYPLMHCFLVSAAYAPYLAYLWLTGKLIGIHSTYPFGLVDPVGALKILTYIGHLVSAFMGAGVVAAAYYTGRLLWNLRTGIAAAILAMVLYPMFYYSRTGNVDATMLFFVALSLAWFARSLREGFSTRLAIIMGICAGFALATKEQSIAIFLAFPLVLLPLRWLDTRSANPRHGWNYWKPFAALGLATFLAFGLGSGLFVDPGRYFAHYCFTQERIAMVKRGEVIWLHTFPNTLQGNLQLAKLLMKYLINTMTLGGVALAGIGVLWTAVRERLVSLFALPALTYLILLFILVRTAELRYLLPAAYVLTFFAARTIILCLESRHRSVRVAGGAVALGVICASLLYGIDLTYAMLKDSRYAAGQWLQRHATFGSHIENFGVPIGFPAIPEGVTLGPAIKTYDRTNPPRIEEEAVQHVLQGWKQRKPDFIVVMPDYTSLPGAPYSRTCPAAIYDGLLEGRYGYRLAAYFETPSVLPWIRRPALDYPSVNPPIRIFALSD